ncbi:hypothetical protein ACORB6_002940 [Listeria monocytogenes]|nr:hypothetical protein [Listeria monocytogenes]EAE1498756.1 hypothetical protein [Listeria monocytogenes]HDI3721971.1 hypothetical protein [Listeria monocytogenes]HDU3385670.1 hypothetical protein [Listeria monocytogenes]
MSMINDRRLLWTIKDELEELTHKPYISADDKIFIEGFRRAYEIAYDFVYILDEEENVYLTSSKKLYWELKKHGFDDESAYKIVAKTIRNYKVNSHFYKWAIEQEKLEEEK